MATVIINNKSKAAKLMLEYLRTQSYAKIVDENEENIPNRATVRAIENARKGNTISCSSFEDYLEKVKQHV